MGHKRSNIGTSSIHLTPFRVRIRREAACGPWKTSGPSESTPPLTFKRLLSGKPMELLGNPMGNLNLLLTFFGLGNPWSCWRLVENVLVTPTWEGCDWFLAPTLLDFAAELCWIISLVGYRGEFAKPFPDFGPRVNDLGTSDLAGIHGNTHSYSQLPKVWNWPQFQETHCANSAPPPGKRTNVPWKPMDGRCINLFEIVPFLGDMLVLGGVFKVIWQWGYVQTRLDLFPTSTVEVLRPRRIPVVRPCQALPVKAYMGWEEVLVAGK